MGKKVKKIFSWFNVIPLLLIVAGVIFSSMELTGNVIGPSQFGNILSASLFSIGLVWMLVAIKLN